MNAAFAIALSTAALTVLAAPEAKADWVATNGPAGALTQWLHAKPSRLFAATHVTALATSGTKVFAGTLNGGVFAAGNDGYTGFVPVNAGLANLEIKALASDGTSLFAATGSGVFRRPLTEL